MKKQGRFVLLMICSLQLTGCITTAWTGAQLVYDRHNIYKKLSDYQLAARANRGLFQDTIFKCEKCALDVAVFNGDLLVAGHVPSDELKQEAQARMEKIRGCRRFFNQLAVANKTTDSLYDSWITTKIRSQIIADDDINPNAFKIVTSDAVVYIMGDVKPEQAKKVIDIARYTTGVVKVVKMMKYFSYHEKSVA